jgi:hypothetical protein
VKEASSENDNGGRLLTEQRINVNRRKRLLAADLLLCHERNVRVDSENEVKSVRLGTLARFVHATRQVVEMLVPTITRFSLVLLRLRNE